MSLQAHSESVRVPHPAAEAVTEEPQTQEAEAAVGAQEALPERAATVQAVRRHRLPEEAAEEAATEAAVSHRVP